MKIANRSIALICLLIAITPMVNAAEPVPLNVDQLEIETAGIDLPPSIRIRNELNKLQKPERDRESKAVGLGNIPNASDIPHYGLRLFRASDGMVFLTDNSRMALWIREKEEWKALVTGVHVIKTFGGAPPSLPCRYLGNGLFAITETLPGEIKERDAENLNLPQALAATFLIDSAKTTVLGRSKAFLYSEQPPIRIPDDWAETFNFVENQDKD